jgi:hypothetical protein
MNALIADLISLLPEDRNAALRRWEARLQATIERSFKDAEEKSEASMVDRQGLGIPRRSPSLQVTRPGSSQDFDSTIDSTSA